MHEDLIHRPIIPIGRDWLIAADPEAGYVQAYDSETLRLMFSGRFIPPKAYRNRDPRAWSDRLLRRLLAEYGLYGGTQHAGAIFVLVESITLRVLMRSRNPAITSEVARMPLVEALGAGREVYEEFMETLQVPRGKE